MVNSPNTTSNTPAALAPDLIYLAPADLTTTPLINTITNIVGTATGDRPVTRVPFVGDPGTLGFVKEGAAIDDAGTTLDEAVIRSGKIAGLAEISNELKRAGNTVDLLTDGMSRSLAAKADDALINSPATGAASIGLINQPGVSDGGALDDSMDCFITAVALVETAGGSLDAWLMHPLVWARIARIKTAPTSSQALLNASTPNGDPVRVLAGRPVIVTVAMPQTKILGVDREAIVAAVSEVEVAVSDQVEFKSDKTVLRFSWRLGWTAMRPARLVKINVPAE